MNSEWRERCVSLNKRDRNGISCVLHESLVVFGES
jgi:hypothetical protein